MALKLMYITNNPFVAQIAENAGVDRIFIDMEYIGKNLRQGGMDTVQSHHTFEDIVNISKVIKKSELLVRVNPIHQATENFTSSEEEIESVIKSGADIIMLPYFKTIDEVKIFLRIVNSRVKTMLLIETPESVEIIDEILSLDGIDEIFIGLNDLSLGYHKKFMFELLSDGVVENLCKKFSKKGLSYGFGGLASLNGGLLPGEKIVKEHYRLGSSCVILSRSFCNTSIITQLEDIKNIFETEIPKIRSLEFECENKDTSYFDENAAEISKIIKKIVNK